MQDASLRLDRQPDVRVVVQPQLPEQNAFVVARLDCERTLCRRGRDDVRVDALVDPPAFGQTIEPRRGDDDRVDLVLVDAVQARVDVAVQGHYAKIRSSGAQKAGPARAICADARPPGQARQRAAPVLRDQRIPWIGPHRVRRDDKVALLDEGHVLGAVHRGVDLAALQRPGDGGDEDPLAGLRVGGPDIALRDDADELDLVAGLAQALGEPLSLRQRQH